MSFNDQIAKLRHSPMLKRVIGLYGLHVANYLFPLITIPYLARVLGPAVWGTFAFTDGAARLVCFFVEYGFHLSATRDVARHRHDPARAAALVSAVLGAQAILSCLVLVVIGISMAATAVWQQNGPLMAGGLLWALAQAANPMWFFQGLEDMFIPSLLDITAKALQLGGILLLVHQPDQAWRVFCVQAIAASLSTVGGYYLLTRSFSLPRPDLSAAISRLREGLTIFFYRSTVILYTTANVVILGLMISPAAVGYFAGAERICRAAIGFLHPLNQAFFPRINHQLQHDPQHAQKTIRWSTGIMTAYGLLIMVTLYSLAPQIVRTFLGSNYEPSVRLLQMMALIAPLNAISNALGLQWMIPQRMDVAFQWIITAGAAVNIALAFLLVPSQGGAGMTWSVVMSELSVVAAILIVLQARAANPIWSEAAIVPRVS